MGSKAGASNGKNKIGRGGNITIEEERTLLRTIDLPLESFRLPSSPTFTRLNSLALRLCCTMRVRGRGVRSVKR